MYRTLNGRREKSCQCPCHCHCRCINNELNSKSLSDIYTQNPNSDFPTSFYNENNPLLKSNDICNYIYSPNKNDNDIKNIRLRERAQSIKDAINSRYFMNNINNKTCNNWNRSFKNNNNNFDNMYNFNLGINPLNRNSLSPLMKNKFKKGIDDENWALKRLLSKVPRHAKSPRNNRTYMDNLRLSFSKNTFGRKPSIKSYINNRKLQGYTSVIMPPNDLDNIVIKNNINI